MYVYKIFHDFLMMCPRPACASFSAPARICDKLT